MRIRRLIRARDVLVMPGPLFLLRSSFPLTNARSLVDPASRPARRGWQCAPVHSETTPIFLLCSPRHVYLLLSASLLLMPVMPASGNPRRGCG